MDNLYVAEISKIYKWVNSKGKIKKVYHADCYELVTNDLGELTVAYGPDKGLKVGFREDVKIKIFPIEDIIKITGTTDYDEIIKRCYDLHKDLFCEIDGSGEFVPINDDELKRKANELNQHNELFMPQPKINLPKINELYKYLTSNIICQDNQVKSILSSIYNNLLLAELDMSDNDKSKLKQNILISGPTGTGKTEIMRQIAKILEIPMVIEDSTRYTEAGYVGASIDDVFLNLLAEARDDLFRAEHGIIVFDEFDKLANNGDTSNDVGKMSVQQSLLTMMEGSKVPIEVGGNSNKRKITFDTSLLTVVGLGAFAGIEKIKKCRLNLDKPMGFKTSSPTINTDNEPYVIKDYVDYGILNEILGRMGLIVQMNSFNVDALKKILLTSQSSILLLKKQFYNKLGVNLIYDDEFIDALCTKAYDLGCGARSLNTILNQIFSDLQFDIYTNQYKEVILSKDTVENYKQYILK